LKIKHFSFGRSGQIYTLPKFVSIAFAMIEFGLLAFESLPLALKRISCESKFYNLRWPNVIRVRLLGMYLCGIFGEPMAELINE
jgi:hypothetical protein